jgi:hypothetical protein
MHKDLRKYTDMRHSAATDDPNNFKGNGSTLHQVHDDLPVERNYPSS